MQVALLCSTAYAYILLTIVYSSVIYIQFTRISQLIHIQSHAHGYNHVHIHVACCLACHLACYWRTAQLPPGVLHHVRLSHDLATSHALSQRAAEHCTHNLTVLFVDRTFHSCIALSNNSTHIRIYISIHTASHPLLFVLYYCTSIESTLVAYCISSTALHPLSLQVVSAAIVAVIHIITLLYLSDT